MSAETNSKQLGMSVLETIPEMPGNSGGASSPRLQLPSLQAAASSGGDGTAKTTTSTTTTMTTAISHSSSGSDSFNTEDFLARVNKNDKICNILRTPGGGVRQRSVYTAINSSTRFNVAATPFISQMPMSASSMGHGMSAGSSLANGAGNQMILGMSVKDACMPNGGHMMHMVPPSPHHHFGPGGYETPMTSRSSGINNRPVPYSGRYMSPQQQTQMYFENDITRLYPQPMPPPPFAVNRVNSQRDSTYDKTPPPCPGAGPLAMANGTIQLRLRDGIRIDMTLDRSVRVLNQRSMVAMSLSRNCANAALIHPNGRILQSGSKIEIVTYDGMKTNNFVRYAKMWYKGVSFTSESCALIYLVDTAGTRTTTDTFTDLTKDYTLSVFYDDARHGPSFFKEAYDVVKAIEYTCTEDGTDVYDINGFRITQAADGLVKVTRNNNKCLIRTSPGNGSATLTTPGIHCTASLGKTSHLFVRRNEKRMHFDGSSFIVRNAGHSAGFNESNLLIVY